MGDFPDKVRSRPCICPAVVYEGYHQWAAALLIAVLISAQIGCNQDNTLSVVPTSQRTNVPLKIQLQVPRIFLPGEPADLDALLSRVWPAKNCSFGSALHALRIVDSDSPSKNEGKPSFDELLSLVLDSKSNAKWFNGSTSLISTRNGVRYLTGVVQPTAQAHPDQALSVLAELGTPLDKQVHCLDRTFKVRDILNDSVANFSLNGELEWTTVAFARYLPPRRDWQNKFNQTFNFDQLAGALMARRFDRAACGGTHSLYALATVYRADEHTAILSDTMRRSVGDFLLRAEGHVERKQRKDGAFQFVWYSDLLKDPSHKEDLRKFATPGVDADALATAQTLQEWGNLYGFDSDVSLTQITAHHLEWLLLLPHEMQPPDGVYREAAQYLCASLRRATDDQLKQGMCPYSHAARIVRLFATESRRLPGSTQLKDMVTRN